MEDIKIINDITKIIETKHNIFTSMGVKNGIAGASLFFYYKSLYNEKDFNLDKCISFLESAINGLNDNYIGNSIISDIMEIGKLINFYIERDILSYDDNSFYFEKFDIILSSLLEKEIKNKNINALTGAISFGYYFLDTKQYNSPELYKIIEKIYEIIKYKIIRDGDYIYWKSEIKRDGKNLIELNITHGNAGIINFLIEVYKNNIINSEDIVNIINLSVETLLNYQKAKGICLFPFDKEEYIKNDFSLNLIYGDIGIAYVIYKAGKILKNSFFIEKGIEILINASTYRDNNNYILDVNLNYGCLGLSSFFRFFNNIEPNPLFLKSSTYWKQQYPILRNNNSDEWCGFESVNNKWDVNTNLSFGHGIIGIGIALISDKKKLDLDFLKFLNINNV